jgi:Secretion system C-terminal sorting domain
MKFHFTFLSIVSLLLLTMSTLGQYGGSPCMGTQTVRMSFANGVITGTVPTPANPVTGMQVTYSNVLTNTPITQQIDAVFTLDAIDWGGLTAEFTSFNPDVNPLPTAIGPVDNFQPSFITAGATAATNVGTYNMSNTWTVRFYLAGTTTPAFLPIVVQTIDNDGATASASSPTRRVDIIESVSYLTPASSMITSTGAGGTPATTQILSGNTFTMNAPVNQPSIGTGREYIAFANYGNTSSFQVKFNHQLVFTSTTATATFNNGSRFSSLHIGCDFAGSTDFSNLTLSGNVFNDATGLTDGTVNGTSIFNPSGAPLYANLLSEDGLTIIATVAVDALGQYSFPVGANSNYQVQITTTSSTAATAPAVATLPAGWVATGESNNGLGTSSDGTPNQISTLVTVGTSNVSNINFGIQERPESAVNSQIIGTNPGGTVNTTVNPNWFENSNVGTNPNTQDYSGGMVENIRITAFPSNATSISINGITYGSCSGCTTWPAGGVTVPAPGGVPSQTITVDPVDGLVSVVIPFAAIDNAGKEDLTPGSVTLVYTSVLPIQLLSFTALSTKNCSVQLTWRTVTESNVKQFDTEHSSNGINFSVIGTTLPTGSNSLYTLVDKAATKGINYYRLRTVDNDGRIQLSKVVKFDNNCTGYISIYPNPVINEIKIEGFAAGQKVTVRLFDGAGKLLMNNQYAGNSIINVAVPSLPIGVYQLNVFSNTVSKTFAIIKK